MRLPWTLPRTRRTDPERRPRSKPRRPALRVDGCADGACVPLEPRMLPSVDVLTYHNNNQRTGLNASETILTPANVNAQTFGKVGQVQVDGQVYAQPLYKSNVLVPGRGIRNVVYVATAHDSVYAFDAQTLQLLWKDSFINPARGIFTVPSSIYKTPELGPEIGIVGTPVIDPSTSALYVVAKTLEVSPAGITQAFRLHALDLGTGREVLGGPVTIGATVRGTGTGSFLGFSSFDPIWEFQRPALLLDRGVVYIAWASQGDKGPFHGWVIGYNSRTLRQVVAWNNTPNGETGGIWMSGGGPAADQAGNIYMVSGNGTFSANTRGGQDYGDTLTKQAPFSLKVLDYFTPFNQQMMKDGDIDFGSGGVTILPDQPGLHRHLLVTGGKEGRMYLVDRDNMGKYSPWYDRVVQSLPGITNADYATAAYFNGTLYLVGTGPQKAGRPRNVLLAMHLFDGRVAYTTAGNVKHGYPGATPSISSSGNANGIVWALDNGKSVFGLAILRAYDANNVSRLLYDSAQAGTRDQAGTAVKFSVPTVADGRVYVGGTGFLTVYGLLPNPAPG